MRLEETSTHYIIFCAKYELKRTTWNQEKKSWNWLSFECMKPIFAETLASKLKVDNNVASKKCIAKGESKMQFWLLSSISKPRPAAPSIAQQEGAFFGNVEIL